MGYLLAFFFFMMYTGDDFGLNVSLGLPGMSTKNLLLYLILAGIAINAAVAKNRNFDLPSVTVTFTLLILYAVMSWITVAFIVPDQFYSIRQSFIVLKSSLVDQMLTFLIYFFGILYLKDSLWLLRAIIWIVVVGNVVTIIDTFNIPNLGILDVARKAGRFQGFLDQPNAYGQFLVLFIPSTIVLYLKASGKLRVLAGIGAFASILDLVLSGSRGSYVGLIAGAGLAAFFLRNFLPTQAIMKAGMIALAVLCIAIGITIVTGYAGIWLDRTLSFEGSAHVITHGRTTIWSTALKPMIEQPLTFLTGFGFFAYESGMYAKSTHNVYLSFLYNLGLIGLGLFIAIFIRILVTARSALRYASDEYHGHLVAVVFGLCGFMVAIFFSEYQRSGYLLWAYLGVCMRIATEITKHEVGVASVVANAEGRMAVGAMRHSAPS